MSCTESEDFESADEEFNESPKKVIEPKTKNTTSEKADAVCNNFDNNSVEAKDLSVEKLKINETKDVKTSVLADSTEERWDVNDWKDDSNNPNSSPPAKETDQKTELTRSEKENEAEDGWGWSDFDNDWSEGSPAKAPVKSEISSESPTKNIPESTKPSEDSMSSVFPILDQMSPEKQPKRTEGILHNLSKFVNKSEFISNYDAFPVLNEISTTKNVADSSAQTELREKGAGILPLDNSQPVPPSASSTYSWAGWKSWGGMASTILSTATEGVTSLTSQVSQGLSSVLEAGIGAPDPEELARIIKAQEKSQIKETDGEDDSNASQQQEETLLPSLGNIVSGVTHIGSKVITGGLDTLEGIGKKTMTILQENDPLLLKKRRFLGLEPDRPVLSQALREAKEKTEEIERNLKQMHRSSYRKQLHFEWLFDHYYGLVHLEALEMLSKQSSIKLQSVLEPFTGKALAELQETLNEVKELCDLGDLENDDNDGLYTDEELTEKLSAAVEDFGVQTDFADIIKCWKDNVEWLTENTEPEAQEVYEKGLRCLAETCAIAIHRYHKIAEILLIKEHHSTANEADSLVQLTTTFCWHLSGIANRFGGKLNAFEQNEEINQLITSIFVEAYKSNSYIQSAFQLFIPILQIGAA